VSVLFLNFPAQPNLVHFVCWCSESVSYLVAQLSFSTAEFGNHRWAWSNPWGEKATMQSELGTWALETVKENFLFDLQDVSFSKSSLNPRAIMSIVCFNV
jgi:hypothetical protein